MSAIDTVWIAEDEDFDDDGSYWLGTFSAYLDKGRGAEEGCGLTAEEAVAWGRARAQRVFIMLGDSGYYSAGSDDDNELAPWPPDDLPPLTKRRAGEQG